MAKKDRFSKFRTLMTGNPDVEDAEAKSASFRRWVDRYVLFKDRCGSPIEIALGHAIGSLWEEAFNGPLTVLGPGEHPSTLNDVPEGMTILCQYPVAGYRADFLVAVTFGGPALLLVVECDGHDFHEKTRRQAQHDKARDRDFLLAGFRTVRFTGSEINKHRFECAEEVLHHIGMIQVSEDAGG